MKTPLKILGRQKLLDWEKYSKLSGKPAAIVTITIWKRRGLVLMLGVTVESRKH